MLTCTTHSLIIPFDSLIGYWLLLKLVELSIDLALSLDAHRSNRHECVIDRDLVVVAFTETDSSIRINGTNLSTFSWFAW